MPINSQITLAVPPGDIMAATNYSCNLAHMAYRIGGGPHLFRTNLPIPARGGWMVIDDDQFDGHGTPEGFCQEVVHECIARGYTAVVLDFQTPRPLLHAIVSQLSQRFAQQQWPLFVPEAFAMDSDTAVVLIGTALSGGTLVHRFKSAMAQYGVQRVAMAIEPTAMDFYLPAPTGQGRPLTQEMLQEEIAKRSPSIFFSPELCAHYFTYMNQQNGAHFILFDNAGSVRKKLEVAQQLSVPHVLLPYPALSNWLPDILRPSFTK